jgi:tetratricopeptide (TPR) repeat protein
VLKLGGRLDDAEVVYDRVAELQRRSGIPYDHPLTAAAMTAGASVARARRALGRAEPLYREAVTILERLPDRTKHTRELATALNNLGTSLSASGKPEEAVLVLTRSLKLMEEARGAGSSYATTVAEHLGAAYLALGDGASASLIFSRVVELKAKALGENHLDVAISLTQLVKAAKVDPETTLDPRGLLKRAVSIMMATGELHGRQVAEALDLLAQEEEVAGNYTAAAVLFERVVAAFVASEDDDGGVLGRVFVALGRTRLRAGDAAGAVEALQQSMQRSHGDAPTIAEAEKLIIEAKRGE